MNKCLFLLITLLPLHILSATQFASIEKPLHAELKRQLLKAEYSMKPMESKHASNGVFYELVTKQSNIRYIYTGRVETARSGNGSKAATDYLDYFILFDVNKTVQKVKIVRFQSDHGQGVTSAGWLKQFTGFNPTKSLEIGKEIDAISGATQTVNKLTFDIKSKTLLLNKQ